MYDGFISYSHAADDLLAPRLQAGLQRFAKPWWKRRAVRMFRDESSLSANPDLWSSITEALDDSEWFVLLLSEEAASSEWVGREIEHWVANKDPEQILPVVTSGEFGWTNGEVAGSSVAPSLRGVFSEEPRWVDLRFAKDEDQLDLKNPAFLAVVADVASALRGVPKDELASEEVKQHRRTIRTAWAVGAVVAVLGVAAVVFGIQAGQQRNLAETNAAEAQANADEATTQRQLAEDNAEAESVARAEAEREAKVARSRELTASAVAVLSEDPELSIMLALESIEATPQGSTPSPQGVRTLREAVLTSRLVARFDGFGNYARISPDGSIMYYADDEANTVIAVQIDTGEELWSSDPIPVGSVGRVEISPDGEMVSVQVHQPGDHQILVFGASDGLVIATLSPGDGCSGTDFEGLSAIGGFSPGGQWFSVFTGMAGCGEVAGESWISVYDTSTWDESFQLNTDDGLVFSAYFSTDATRVLLTSHGGTAELRSFPDLELINTLDNMFIAAVLSPDGQRIATVENGPRGPFLADSTTGDLISSLNHAADAFAYVEPFVFSGDGSKLVVAARSRDYLFNGVDGDFLGTLATGQTISSSFTADGSQLLTTTLGTPLIWNLTTGHPIAGDGLTGDWINPEQATSGPHLAVNVIDFEGDPYVLALLDPVSGFVVKSRNEWGSQLADGRFVAVGWEGSFESYTVGPLEIWDPTDDTTSVLGGCVVHGKDDKVSERKCPDGELFFAGSEFGAPFVAVSDTDGSVFAAQSSDDQSLVVVWDAESLSRISEFPIPKEQTLVGMTDTWVVASVTDKLVVYGFGGEVIATVDLAVAGGPPLIGSVEFSPDESLLLTRDAAGTVYVYDTGSWERVAAWEAHPGVIRGWHLSKDGQRLATAGEEGFVHIWELGPLYLGETPEAPVLTIPVVGRPSDVAWLSDEQLAVFLIDRGTGARWFTVLLDTEDLVDDARTRLTRGFTASECAIYLIEDCPVTLEEIRSR